MIYISIIKSKHFAIRIKISLILKTYKFYN